MKFAVKSLPFLIALAAALAYAQTNNIPQVQHVIVVIQENRTPDNLFGSDAFANQRQLPGADLVQSGNCSKAGQQSLPLMSIALGDNCDPNHGHKGAWKPTYDNGKMDGACTIGTQKCTLPDPQYAYVQSSDVQPYFSIATNYGYASYMFQTNQGPSFPAHQFLISGTSAPAPYLDPSGTCTGPYPSEKCWQWFDAENVLGSKGTAGCPAGSKATALLIDPTSVESLYYTPPPPVNVAEGFPCYSHPSLPTLLDNAGVSWRYYLREPHGGLAIWTGPAAIYDLCVDPNKTWNGTCNKDEYLNNVQHYLPGGPNYSNDYAPILTDIANCKLPQVSWVIPDGNWSDHARRWTAPRGMEGLRGWRLS